MGLLARLGALKAWPFGRGRPSLDAGAWPNWRTLAPRSRPPRVPESVRRRRAERRARILYLVVAIVLILGTVLVFAPVTPPLPEAPIESLGEYSSVTLSRGDPPTLYVGTGSRLLASQDGGQSWRPVALPLREAGVVAVLSDPRQPGVLYGAGPELGVIKSEDGGASWRTVLPGGTGTTLAQGLPAAGHLVTALAMDPQEPGRLWAWSFGRGLLVSEDGGASWSYRAAATAVQASQVSKLLAATGDPVVLWAATSRGLYRSADGGATWSLAAPEIGDMPLVSVAQSRQQPAVLYALSSEGAIWRSEDGGETWAMRGMVPEGERARDLTVDAGDAQSLLLLTEGRRLFRSLDGGEGWALVHVGL